MKFAIISNLLKNIFKKPITVMFPQESIPIPDGYRGEHEHDRFKCISCGLCAMICPNKAIEMVQTKEGKKYPEIDIGKCCFCGLCQDICPTSALKLTKNIPHATDNPASLIKKPEESAKS